MAASPYNNNEPICTQIVRYSNGQSSGRAGFHQWPLHTKWYILLRVQLLYLQHQIKTITVCSSKMPLSAVLQYCQLVFHKLIFSAQRSEGGSITIKGAAYLKAPFPIFYLQSLAFLYLFWRKSSCWRMHLEQVSAKIIAYA